MIHSDRFILESIYESILMNHNLQDVSLMYPNIKSVDQMVEFHTTCICFDPLTMTFVHGSHLGVRVNCVCSFCFGLPIEINFEVERCLKSMPKSYIDVLFLFNPCKPYFIVFLFYDILLDFRFAAPRLTIEVLVDRTVHSVAPYDTVARASFAICQDG